jgi:fucose 4-O-acetylase-like acetyltransferase
MVAIVSVHSISSVLLTPLPWVRWLVESFIKFGTIDFFIISGFLLGDRFESGSPSTFLRRRLKKIVPPWSVWFLILTVWVLVAGRLLKHKSGLELVQLVGAGALNTLTSTPFWFVPNLFFSICLLLLVRKSLRKEWLGFSLFLATLFYTLNIYTCWVPSAHTVALCGYVFFIWLGALISRNYQWLLTRLQIVSVPVTLFIVVSLALISAGESHLVSRFTPSDPLNTLRFSNQLYSLGVIFLLMRLQRPVWPSFLNVRTQMFGVYLIHPLVLRFLLGLARSASHVFPSLSVPYSTAEMVTIGIALSTVVFSISAVLSRQIGQSRLGWLVGDLSARGAKPQEREEVVLQAAA